MEILGSCIVAIILFAVLAAIIVKLIRDKHRGKSSCGCGCSGCPNASLCHGNAEHVKNT